MMSENDSKEEKLKAPCLSEAFKMKEKSQEKYDATFKAHLNDPTKKNYKMKMKRLDELSAASREYNFYQRKHLKSMEEFFKNPT